MENVRLKEAEALKAAENGNHASAVSLWKEILSAYPNWEHGYGHYHLGNCYVDAGRLDLAIEAYRKAIDLAPEDSLFSETLESLLEARKLGYI